ncbi:MAG: potassium-transporting ATPase subunit KdpC [Parachlamydiaceae bacterium]|nr:potassium-transporting ATPase subunit KdpC [Parachlamydiaceae bacterium]
MFWTACKVFFTFTVITGFLYPLLITGIATLTMPHHANGSLVEVDGQIRGSLLIAQPFKQDKYFWPRPSAIEYDPLHSGGSNLGPTSRVLKDRIHKEGERLSKVYQQPLDRIPVEFVYTSGSGLDPHISEEAAYFQLERVMKARSFNSEQSEKFKKEMHSLREGHQLGLGPHYFNVLKLNIFLDQYSTTAIKS